MMKRILAVLIPCLLVVLACPAFAQDDETPVLLTKNTHLFHPVTDGSGLIVTYGSEGLGPLGMSYGIYGDLGATPWNWEDTGGSSYPVIKQQAAGNLLFAVGVLDQITLGFALPYVFMQSYDEDLKQDDWEESAFEDIRADQKFTILQRRKHCLGIGLVNTVTIPMYTEYSFTSDKGVTVAPRLLADFGRGMWTVAFNGGYKYYSIKEDSDIFTDIKASDEILLNLGGLVRLKWGQAIVLDTAFRTAVDGPFGTPETDYGELMAAYRKTWVRLNTTVLTVGGSVGLGSGIGSPMGRVFVGFTRDEHRARYQIQEYMNNF